MKFLALLIMLIVPDMTRAQQPLPGAVFDAPQLAGGPITPEQHQQAIETVRQYAIDMNTVLPCFIMWAPEKAWDQNYGEPELELALAGWMQRGATAQQINELRAAYAAHFKPVWVQDIRQAARACLRGEIPDKIAKLDAIAQPLFLRPPFQR
jgi:hypothetical protein